MKGILIADDHEILREGIRRVLQTQTDWVVLGEAADGKEAVEKTLALNPDLVILDINMPVLNGLDALRQIRQLRPQVKVLVFTVNNSEQANREIIAAGSDGYLCKSNASDDVIETLKTIFERECSFSYLSCAGIALSTSASSSASASRSKPPRRSAKYNRTDILLRALWVRLSWNLTTGTNIGRVKRLGMRPKTLKTARFSASFLQRIKTSVLVQR